ncbi:MAG: GAF domain-containing protein [Candidatus Omnitrophica bacterium]|nr:GAF domain-containing protein [Candidatus Omnitrophota bacterium]
MNTYTISSIIAFAISFSLSLFVYLKGIQDKSRKAIIFIILCAGTWCLFPFLAWIGWPEKSLFFTRLVYIAAIFTAPAFLNFGLTVLDIEKVPKERKLIKGSFIASILVFLPFLFSPIFIRNIKRANSYFSIVGGPLYIIFILYFGIVCLYCFYKLYLGIRESSGSKKNQIRYVFAGFLLAFFSGLIHFSTSLGLRELFPHDFLVVACMIVLTYSIIRYRLMDITVAITRTGIFIAVYTLVLGIPFAVTGWLRQWLIEIMGANWWVGPLSLMAALATVGPFIYIFLERRAEGRLLKEQRRYQNTLKQAALGMTRIRDLKKLLNLTVHIVTKTVGISFAAIYLHDSETNEYILQASRNKNKQFNSKLTADSPIVTWITTRRQPVIYEEIKRQMEDFGDITYRNLEENMRQISASVIIPSFLEDRSMGLIILGDKISGQIYTPDDLSVFQVLATQAALAIENALFYEEAKTMQEQIAQAEKMATIGTMADGLSHQINNRFNALSLIASDALDTLKITDTSGCSAEFKKFTEEMKYALERIQANVMQGGQVVQGLLKYSRKGDKGLEPLELNTVLDNTMEMAQYKVKLSEIDIVRDFPQDLAKIKGNLAQLQEMFFNFIDNAYDAIVERRNMLQEEGYRGRITVSAQPKDNVLEIIVKDNGLGVKEEDKKKVFTPFFTTKVSSRRGTGLGLYVINKIITDTHKGRIDFDSEYKTGTRFTLELPIAK